jgi:hypothetical protein
MYIICINTICHVRYFITKFANIQKRITSRNSYIEIFLINITKSKKKTQS